MHDFGEVLRHLKCGGLAARAGWNGKGMAIWMEPGSLPADMLLTLGGNVGGVPISHWNDGIEHYLFSHGQADTVMCMPRLDMRAANGATITGWLANQTDMLATDWQLLPKARPGV